MWCRIFKGVGEPLHEPIDDPAFPGLMVHTGAPHVVEGPSVGRIELHEHDRKVLVGTSEGTLHPPKGWGRRSAGDVSATLDGRQVKLAHRRLKASRLLLDGAEVGALKSRRHGRTPHRNDRSRYEVSWAPGVDPRVAGVGHALATRYGVGAPGAGRRFLLFLADLVGGP